MTQKELKKQMKEEIRKIWIDQIKTAMRKADEAIEGCEDNGTCNFDMVLIKAERNTKWAEAFRDSLKEQEIEELRKEIRLLKTDISIMQKGFEK